MDRLSGYKDYGRKVAQGLFCNYIPVMLVALGFVIYYVHEIWTLPFGPDSLEYCTHVNNPFPSLLMRFRYFNVFVAKIVTTPCDSILYGVAVLSLSYAVGIIILAFLLIKDLSNRTFALLGSMIVATHPALMMQASWYNSDQACLFYGLLALWLALWAEKEDRARYVKILFSGFFLVGAVFSKRPAVCFAFPALMILWRTRSCKAFKVFFIGAAACMLFMAVCDAVWMGDFFYHINPGNYFDFNEVFFERAEALVEKGQTGGNKWTPTLVMELQSASVMLLPVFVYIACSVAMVCSAAGKTLGRRRYVGLAILLVGISSILLHESFHVFMPMLAIWPRYRLTIIIPSMIAFAALIAPENIKADQNRKSESLRLLLDYLVVFLFVALLFVTRRDLGVAKALRSSWNLYGGVLKVFSFWLFIAGMGTFMFFQNRAESAETPRKSMVYRTVSMLGFVIIIWFTSVWLNVRMCNRYPAYQGLIKSNAECNELYRKYGDKMLVHDIGSARSSRNMLTFAYLDGSMSKERFQRLWKENIKGNLPLNLSNKLTNKKYEYIMTRHGVEGLQSLANVSSVTFEQIWKVHSHHMIRDVFCYRIVRAGE